MSAKVLVPTSVLLVLAIIVIALIRPRSHKVESTTNLLQVEEEYFLTIPSAESINQTLYEYSREAKQAGTPGAQRTAQMIVQRFKDAGLNTTTEDFFPLLSYVDEDSREISFTDPDGKQVQLVLKEDERTPCENCAPTYLGYSADGDITKPIVFGNYGARGDYAKLKEMGVSVEDKIMLVKYGMINRGTKVRIAQEHKAAGVIIYSDPADDSTNLGEPYPKGPGRPEDGVQRGSLLDISVFAGDPMSVGWAALGEDMATRRLDMSKEVMPTIPALPISFREAEKLMTNMGGDTAPEEWKGGLKSTYKVGGELQVRLKVKMNNKYTKITDVIGKIVGLTEPEKYVVIGCHYDAWIKGAVDPGTGLVTLLETVKGFGKLLNAGWRPRRTIIFAAWDAEEQGLIGSTEWVEKHRVTLAARAVAYLNLDVTVAFGDEEQYFAPAASPALRALIKTVAQAVPMEMPSWDSYQVAGQKFEIPYFNKGGELGQSVFDYSKNAEGELTIAQLGSGSDFTPFQQHLGIASLAFGWRPKTHREAHASYGQYHSINDDWTLVNNSVAFRKYLPIAARIFGIMCMRLANNALIPLNYGEFAEEITRTMVTELKSRNVDTDYPEDYKMLQKAVGRVGPAFDNMLKTENLDMLNLESVGSLLTAVTGLLKQFTQDKLALSPNYLNMVNNALMIAERSMADPEGLPGRPWYKYQVCAPGLFQGYGEQLFPGVIDSITANKPEDVKKYLGKLTSGMHSLATLFEDTMYISPYYGRGAPISDEVQQAVEEVEEAQEQQKQADQTSEQPAQGAAATEGEGKETPPTP